jgi:halocin C8-like bacteriocin domain-containing protein
MSINWIGNAVWDARWDLNADGSVTMADYAHYPEKTLGRGKLSWINNRIGYAGYQHAPELAGAKYLVRHRVLDAERGAWLTRDPLGYCDSMGLYEYVRSMPLIGVDPFGLSCSLCQAVVTVVQVTGCTVGAAVVCVLVGLTTGGAGFFVCTTIFDIICNLSILAGGLTPYQICVNLGYCPAAPPLPRPLPLPTPPPQPEVPHNPWEKPVWPPVDPSSTCGCCGGLEWNPPGSPGPLGTSDPCGCYDQWKRNMKHCIDNCGGATHDFADCVNWANILYMACTDQCIVQWNHPQWEIKDPSPSPGNPSGN